MTTLRLEGAADAGQTIAHHDGRIVFVTGGLPGELVTVELDDPDARILRGVVTEVLEASEHRVADRRAQWTRDPAALGGVEFAHAADDYARALKFQAVQGHFRRIAGLDIAGLAEGAEARAPQGEGFTPERWRTRVQFAVDAQGRPGAHRPRSHDLVALTALPLASPDIEVLDLASLDYSGVTRVEVAVPAGGGEGAVVLRGPARAPDPLVATLHERGLSVLEVRDAREADGGTTARRARGGAGRGRGRARSGKGGRNRGGRAATAPRVRAGEGFLRESPGSGTFRVRADGFWQVHPQAPQTLADAVSRALGDCSGRTVADLYSGAGLLSAGLVRAGADVVGIEGSAAAVEDARHNVPGAQFLAGRVEKLLAGVGTRLDAVVLDPPRSGADRAVTDAIGQGTASTIAYVSCDSATLARDVARLADAGFALKNLEVLDLFPLTGHVECVATLER